MKTKPFHELNAEQVVAFRKLIMLLRRLRTIGYLHTNVTSESSWGVIDEHGIAWTGEPKQVYRIKKTAYSYERIIDEEELLEQIFGRISVRPI